MGFMSGPSAPPPPPPPPPAPPPAANAPTYADPQVQAAGLKGKKPQATGQGFADTIGTSPQGVTGQVNTASKTLLGQ
jgi:hypothetical protein